MRLSRYTTDLLAAREEATRAGRFVQASPHSSRLRCAACTNASPSSFGHPGGSWMDKHLGDHTTCWCGRVVPLAGLKAHQGSRWHPTRKDS